MVRRIRSAGRPAHAARKTGAANAATGNAATGNAGQQVIPIPVAIDLAYRHWEAGQMQEAEHLARQILALLPGQTDMLHLLGLIAHSAGRIDLAIDHMKEACAAPGATPAYFSNLGELCRRRGRLAEAEQAARQAVALDGTVAASWSNLGIILQEAGKAEPSAHCLRRVLALGPDMAEGYNNLGNTLRRLDRGAEAARHYGAALALDPLYVDACCNLGSLTGELGRHEEGLGMLRRAIGLDPRLPGAYLNAAEIEQSRGRGLEALGWLEALRDFAPDHPALPAGRSGILLRLGRAGEALAVAEAGLAASPGRPDILNAAGTALQAMGRYEEALDAVGKAAAADGNGGASGLIGRAVLLTQLGRLEEAAAAFSEARRRFPRCGAAWYGAVDLLPCGEDETARLEAMLEAPSGLGRDDRSMLHFTLGAARLAAGNAEGAFAHFARGNALKRSALAFDAAATEGWIDAIARAFPAGRLAAGAAPACDRSELPVFVIGMPRSGTSLVEQILASHPAIHGAGELQVLEHVVNRVTLPDGRPVPYPLLAEVAGPDDLAELGRRYLDQVSGLAGDAVRLVDKMPLNFLYAGLIALALPGARIVHCRRDALDCCLSNYTRLFQDQNVFAYDLEELGRFHRAYQRLMAHWRSVLPPDRFLELDYEALVAEPEVQARRLLAFCGVAWDPASLDFHRNRRRVTTASAVQVRRPIHSDAVGRGQALAEHLAPLVQALRGDGSARP